MNDQEEIMERLKSAWQRQSAHVDRMVQSHGGPRVKPVPRLLVFSSRKRQLVASVAMAAMSLATLAVMVVFRRRLVADIFDFALILALLLVLAATAVHSMVRARAFLPSRMLSRDSRRRSPSSPARFAMTGVPSFAAVAVVLIFLALPLQSGRVMSPGVAMGERSALVADVTMALSQMVV